MECLSLKLRGQQSWVPLSSRGKYLLQASFVDAPSCASAVSLSVCLIPLDKDKSCLGIETKLSPSN